MNNLFGTVFFSISVEWRFNEWRDKRKQMLELLFRHPNKVSEQIRLFIAQFAPIILHKNPPYRVSTTNPSPTHYVASVVSAYSFEQFPAPSLSLMLLKSSQSTFFFSFSSMQLLKTQEKQPMKHFQYENDLNKEQSLHQSNPK